LVIKLTVGCHYFLPGPWLPSQLPTFGQHQIILLADTGTLCGNVGAFIAISLNQQTALSFAEYVCEQLAQTLHEKVTAENKPVTYWL